MNITFILESSFSSGGMERMLATIANALSDTYNVTVLTAFNEGRKDFFPFKEGVKRVDLHIERAKFPRPKELKGEYKTRLEDWLMENRQDVTISLGSLEFFFLPDIKDGSKKVFWFHFAFNYDLMTSQNSRCKLLNFVRGQLKRTRRLMVARRYDASVVLTNIDLASWRRYLKNIVRIYNPLTIAPVSVNDYGVKRAIAVGRIQPQKGFDYLVEAWSIIHVKYPDWHLDIYGDGTKDDISFIENLINDKKLKGIVNLMGSTSDIAKAYSEHSIMILSSRYEGLGLVLVEAASCGLPLVSYDCEQGPSEIIDEGKNGFLVSPVGNIKGLADAICKLIQDENLRKTMGAKAKLMSEQFSLEKNTQDWVLFLQGLN